MKNILQTILLILVGSTLLWGQKNFENKKFGFSMQEPENWIVATNEELNKNLEKFDLTEENLSKILATGNGSIVLTAFYKYDAKKHAGLIPTIQIRIRPGNT